ncbi:MAG: hypothetical protein KY457_03760 [Actinobacteria bacterium]|nr:hypothetical protein [Actinomycetota bacterium]
MTCDIADLLPGTDGDCPACAASPRSEIVLDAWDELRALATATGPEPLVLPLHG